MTARIPRRLSAPFTSARPLGGVALAVAAALLGFGVRYGFIEPEQMGAACEQAGPWWCVLRRGLMAAVGWNAIGMAALACALLSFLPDPRRHAVVAHVALALGGAGLVLYNATAASAAVVLALVALALRRQGPAEKA
tara:strand:+ start:1433 stop:1843 length:411 start_codon:yes stop_codon:yes gene_type:complete